MPGDRIAVCALLRDLADVEHWVDEAHHGRFEIDGLPGYLAGIPTYSLMAEVSVAHVLTGDLPVGGAFPRQLAEMAPRRWRFNRDFSLHHADSHAHHGNAAAALGQAARAVLEEAHVVCCERRRWVLNEKHLIAAAGLEHLDGLFDSGAGVSLSPTDVTTAVRAACSGEHFGR